MEYIFSLKLVRNFVKLINRQQITLCYAQVSRHHHHRVMLNANELLKYFKLIIFSAFYLHITHTTLFPCIYHRL